MEERKKEFQKNQELEKYLKEINSDLKYAENELLKKTYVTYPVVLVMGALRSGTTLMTQWLANTGEFACPTNIISRFYEVPIIGAKIQRVLLDPKLAFRDEIIDFPCKIDYSSQNGKTKGGLSPNEFWYFWRRFFPYEEMEIDYMADVELKKKFDKETFVKELMGMANVFRKPLVMKGMIANYNIGFLDGILDKVIFLHIQRNPYSNIASALEAKKRQLQNDKSWFSFRIPEMKKLQCLDDPIEQIAGQIYCTNHAIEESLKKVSAERKIEIQYEDFCKQPEKYYHSLRKKLAVQGENISEKYRGEKMFDVTKREYTQDIKNGYLAFMNRKEVWENEYFKRT